MYPKNRRSVLMTYILQQCFYLTWTVKTQYTQNHTYLLNVFETAMCYQSKL